MSDKLTTDEIEKVKLNRKQGDANQAIESIFFDSEDEELFSLFDKEKLSHKERRRIILEQAKNSKEL